MSNAVFRSADGSVLFTIEDARYSRVVQAGMTLQDEEIEFWVEQQDEDDEN